MSNSIFICEVVYVVIVVEYYYREYEYVFVYFERCLIVEIYLFE